MKALQFVVFVVALVATTAGFAQQPDSIWARQFTFGGNGDVPINIAVGLGNIYVNGWRGDPTTAYGALSGFSAGGNQRWTVRDSNQLSISFAGHVASLGNRAVWFSGVTPGYAIAGIRMVDSNGNQVWQVPVYGMTYLGSRDDTSFVAVLARETNPIAFVYNANGAIVRQFPLPGTEGMMTARSKFLTTADGAVVGEFPESPQSLSGLVTVRARGDDLWIFAHYYGGVYASTSYFVAWYSIATGQLIWRYNFPDVIRGFGDVDADGNAFIAGTKLVNAPGNLKFLGARVAPQGGLVWQREWFTNQRNRNNWVNGAAVVRTGGSEQVILGGAIDRDTVGSNITAYAAGLKASNGDLIWAITKDDGGYSSQFTGCTSLPTGELFLVRNVLTGTGNMGVLYKYFTHPLSVQEVGGFPETFSLSQNYPNPFNPSTVIGFQLTVGGSVLLTVYNLLGQQVATLVDEKLTSGKYEVTWNARNVPSGTYFYRLQTNGFVATKKMVLVK
ncbi:MAG: T9SS type A sorting domain-containing protein [bacterium]|nr:T9SS type A sorting domain-containing protein [bacterium]